MGIKVYGDNYLNNVLGVDAEEVKEDLVGEDSAGSYDIARDDEKNVYLVNKSNSDVIDAEMTQKDMIESYGRDEEETR